jgi:hypothetical protein
MKSRLVKAQNQRVERISTTTLVIGIDIAKEKHAAQAINFRGFIVVPGIKTTEKGPVKLQYGYEKTLSGVIQSRSRS